MDNGEEIRVTSSTGAQKGTKEARYDLIPATPLNELAKVYGKGSLKYTDRNWEAGFDWSLSFAALNRHLWAFWNGEDFDPELGTPHMANVTWHAFVLLEFMNTHPEFDNRPNKPSDWIDDSPLTESDINAAKRVESELVNRYWTDSNHCVWNVDHSDPAPDFWYFEYGDISDIPEYDFDSDNYPEDELVQEYTDGEEVDDCGHEGDIYQILNPEVFGEFRLIGEVEEKPFRVGDRVKVYNTQSEAWHEENCWEAGFVVSNIDWQADSVRVTFEGEKPKWVNVENVVKES